MKLKEFLQNIFYLGNQGHCKVVHILGIKFKINRIIDRQGVKYLERKLEENRDICISNFSEKIISAKSRIINEIKATTAASALHSQTFADYKNCYAGKDIVLIASGPSLNDYIPIENTVNVAVNRAIFYDKVNFDYLFMQDYLAVKGYIEDSADYKNKNLKRFYGLLQPELLEGWVIPESIAIRHNAARYYARSSWDPEAGKPDVDFTYDIASLPLVCHGSVVFPAMQFILYTNPKRIYLVGCDCSRSGYFSGGGGEFHARSRLDVYAME